MVCKRPYKYTRRSSKDRFRNTYEWQQKREEIKKRDKYLCQACINGYDATLFTFNYKDLQVHHIIPLEEDYSRRLDSTNLITLCPIHHKKAEMDIISREDLFKLIKEN